MLTTLAKTTLRLVRLAALGQLISTQARRISKWLEEVHQAHGYDEYRVRLEYILRASKDEHMVNSVIDHSHEDLRDETLSIADRLELRGWARGLADGRCWYVFQQLEHRFGSLPDPIEARIFSASRAELDRWVIRTMDATTLDEIFAEP